jgi:hypothetical protein
MTVDVNLPGADAPRPPTLDELAGDPDTDRLVARMTRHACDDEGADPVRVAAFNSFI